MAELALGAVHSLLGLLRDEAQRLGRVQGDVQFIKEEMESMNSFLLHLASTVPPHGEHDEQVRAWMKQVRDLAFDCSTCIDMYVQWHQGPVDPGGPVSLRGCVLWVPWLVRSLVAQHQAASQLRMLKERAREVGKRRQRYGVEVPKPKADGDEKKQDSGTGGWSWAPPPLSSSFRADAAGGAGEDDLSNLESSISLALDCGAESAAPPILEECTQKLLEWLKKEPVLEFKDCPRVMAIAAPGTRDGGDVAREACHDHSVANQFECKAWLSTEGWGGFVRAWDVLRRILRRLDPEDDEQKKARDDYNEEQLEKEIRGYLQGKRSLIVLDGFSNPDLWKTIQDHLRALGCAAGSAVIVTTKVHVAEARQFFGEAIAYSLVDFFARRASTVVGRNYYRPSNYLRKRLRNILRDIQKRCEPHVFCMKMFVHALYANPNRTKEELKRFRRTLVPALPDQESVKLSNGKSVLMFCYNDLPRAYKTCLLYLAVFHRHHLIRRSRLVGRWAVEGFTPTKLGAHGTLHAADHSFDVLLNRGFVYPVRIDAAGKVKSCIVHHHQLLWELVYEIAREENFVDARVSRHLTQHFSIQSGLRIRRSDNITKFLTSPAIHSPLYRQLKVLDLEGCDGLGKDDKKKQKQCLKNICKILLLRYLSLRDTDVTHLPKEIQNLQQLEVLDIRGTRVPLPATRHVLLPKLKRLLAGRTDKYISPSTAADTVTADESFFTVLMPRRIDRMTNMEVLSHVEAPRDAFELEGISQLWLLRKLGVVIPETKDHLKRFLKVVSDLNECLRSLSVRIKRTPPRSSGTCDPSHPTIPRDELKTSPNLESLSLSGVTSGQLLQLFVRDDHGKQLAKVTLHDTCLKRDDLSDLAKLPNLRSLRLRHKSYSEEQLIFTKDEFQKLLFLVVEVGSGIAAIRFDEGAAPELEKIVWSTTNMESFSLSGLKNLPKVKKIKFNGGLVPEQVRQDIENHESRPVLKHNPPQNDGEGTGSVPAAP